MESKLQPSDMELQLGHPSMLLSLGGHVFISVLMYISVLVSTGQWPTLPAGPTKFFFLQEQAARRSKGRF